MLDGRDRVAFHAPNPVMAPIFLRLLGGSLDRMLSRGGTATSQALSYRLPLALALDVVEAVPQSWYCAVEFLRSSRARRRCVANVTCAAHEFSGSAGLDNFHVRSLNGPAVYRLPLGAITDAHLERAAAWLSTAAVVLPLANLSALRGCSASTLRCQHEVTGAHSTRRDVDPDLRALLEVHNGLDIRLYEGAQALFERRMAGLPRDNR